MSEISQNEKQGKYIDYLVDTYISEDAKFPPIIWAQDTVDGERTTNACESFHAKFNASFSAPSPNIYAFIEVIKQTQVDVNALKNSVNITKQPNKFLKKRMENMEKIKQKYANKELTRFELLKAISYYSSKKDKTYT